MVAKEDDGLGLNVEDWAIDEVANEEDGLDLNVADCPVKPVMPPVAEKPLKPEKAPVVYSTEVRNIEITPKHTKKR